MTDTGQVHTGDSHNMASNHISQVFITKANPTRLCASDLYTSCLCASCLHVTKYILYSWSNQPDYKSENLACYLTWTTVPAFQKIICPRASGYRVDAFLFYRSLKNSNLNLRPNFSPHILSIIKTFFSYFAAHPRMQYRSQKTTCRSSFSPSTMWDPVIEHRSSSALTHKWTGPCRTLCLDLRNWVLLKPLPGFLSAWGQAIRQKAQGHPGKNWLLPQGDRVTVVRASGGSGAFEKISTSEVRSWLMLVPSVQERPECFVWMKEGKRRGTWPLLGGGESLL